MKTAITIAFLVALGVVVTTAFSWAQLDFPLNELLASPRLEAAGELPGDGEESSATPSAPGSHKEEAKPLAVVDEIEFDFGYLENSTEDHRHAFVIKNEGTAPLKLLRSEVSCSKCTFAMLPAEPIPPGGSAAVKVRWNINVHEDVFRQSVSVHTNDREHPLLRFVVTGKVVKPFEIKPKEIVFSNIRVGEQAQASAGLLAYFSDHLEVLEHSLSNQELAPFFDVSLVPVAPDKLPAGVKGATEIKVVLKPGLPLGAFKQRILLKTNLEKGENLELAVSGNIGGPVSVVGAGWLQEQGILAVGQVTRGKGATRTLSLIVRGKDFDGVTLEPPKVKPDLLKVSYGKISQINDGATIIVPVTIEIPPDSPSVNHMGSEQGKLGEIIISFNNPDLPPVKLLVQFAVVEG